MTRKIKQFAVAATEEGGDSLYILYEDDELWNVYWARGGWRWNRVPNAPDLPPPIELQTEAPAP